MITSTWQIQLQTNGVHVINVSNLLQPGVHIHFLCTPDKTCTSCTHHVSCMYVCVRTYILYVTCTSCTHTYVTWTYYNVHVHVRPHLSPLAVSRHSCRQREPGAGTCMHACMTTDVRGQRWTVAVPPSHKNGTECVLPHKGVRCLFWMGVPVMHQRWSTQECVKRGTGLFLHT